MKTLALDARPAQRPPHSFRRLLELMSVAAKSVDLPHQLWTDGPLHPECESFSQLVQPFPQPEDVDASTVMWCLTPDAPPIDHVPYISMICDVNPLLPDGRSRLHRWRRGREFRAKVHRALQSCWKIATDSEDAGRRLIAEFPGMESKLHVIPLYASPSLQPVPVDEQQAVLHELGLEPGFIFFVGSFRRHKNWQGLIKSYALLPEALRIRHPLVFSGAIRRDMGQAQRLIHDLEIAPTVHFLGETPESCLPTLYSAASLFVFPSYMEGFGLPPLEAMQCGTPVIASDRTSIPEVLGKAARYIDPDDAPGMARAMEEVLGDPDLQQRMQEAGLAQAATFNPARTGEAILTMLR